MKKSIVGPMPSKLFLDEFFPTDGIDVVTDFHRGCYNGTLSAGIEEAQAYEGFVSPSIEFRFVFFFLNDYHYF